MKTATVSTPLSKILRFLNITQRQLGERMGLDQSRVSRFVRHCTPPVAASILAALGEPARAAGMDERHLIYPARYADWEPVGNSSPDPAAGQ